MKTGKMRSAVGLAVRLLGIMGMFLLPSAARAQDCGPQAEGGCNECGPHYGAWTALNCGALTNTYSISPTQFGQFSGTAPNVPTNVVFPGYSDGLEQRTVKMDCPQPSTNYPTTNISFIAGAVLWDPPLPAILTNSFSSTAYVISASSDPSVCQNITNILGTVYWCVATNSTNFTDGTINLINTSTNTNYCFGSQVVLTVTTNITNAVLLVTTNCPCDTNLDGTWTTNYPPTILSNWWTVSGPTIGTNTYTNRGSGLTASFTPTNAGTGTVYFKVAYNNAPGDTNTQTAPILSVSFTVAALQPSGTNCVSSGWIALTNAAMNTTNACLGTTFTASASTLTNFGQLVVTNVCPCNTNDVTYTINTASAPIIVSNWWTVSGPGSYTNFGVGLTASTIQPTNPGIGTITFNLTYSNASPCDTTVHAATPVTITFQAVQLQSLTVSGAAQIGPTNSTNWAAVQTNSANAYVTITANVFPNNTNAASLLSWSGGNAVSGNPLQRQVPMNASAETTVTASCCSASFTANVWIIWATIHILTANQNPSNAPAFPSSEPGNLLGLQYSSSSNSVWGKICAVATIAPAGIHNVITNGWNMNQQYKMVHTFIDGNRDANYYDVWKLDSTSFITSIPDTNDNLYLIDGPNIGQFSATNSVDKYINFYNSLQWNSIVCCNTNNYWHWQGRWKIDTTPQINAADVGTGTIPLPTTSYYSP